MPQPLNPAMLMLGDLEGEVIRWWRAMGDCPCRDPERGTFDQTHTLCGGTGVLREEVDVRQYLAILTDATSALSYTAVGPIESGTLLASTMPDEIPLAPGDR